ARTLDFLRAAPEKQIDALVQDQLLRSVAPSWPRGVAGRSSESVRAIAPGRLVSSTDFTREAADHGWTCYPDPSSGLLAPGSGSRFSRSVIAHWGRLSGGRGY